ncbi:peroxisomal targeting signal 2 receptor [Euwallacea fornicatus]|uniref:peroxisomal targeting signal 2 receptor n=1 Tax=Euwallacea fornicatus TaxID=995702 RepID=UPI00338E7585
MILIINDIGSIQLLGFAIENVLVEINFNNKEVMSVFFTKNKKPFSVQFSPLNPSLLALTTNAENGIFGSGTLFTLNITPYGKIQEITANNWPNALFDVRWSPSSKLILTSSGDGALQLWSLTESRLQSSFSAHNLEVSSVDWKIESIILSASWDCTLKIWNSETCQCILGFDGHSDAIHEAQFSPKITNLISSVSSDGTLKLWSMNTKKHLVTIKVHDAEVLSTDWNLQQEHILVTSASDGLIRCWDIRNYLQPLFQLKGSERPVGKIRFSPHFTNITASASFDCSIQISDIRLGKKLEVFRHHTGLVPDIDWCRHELGYLVDCSWDCSVMVFKLNMNTIMTNKI